MAICLVDGGTRSVRPTIMVMRDVLLCTGAGERLRFAFVVVCSRPFARYNVEYMYFSWVERVASHLAGSA